MYVNIARTCQLNIHSVQCRNKNVRRVLSNLIPYIFYFKKVNTDYVPANLSH